MCANVFSCGGEKIIFVDRFNSVYEFKHLRISIEIIHRLCYIHTGE